MKRIGAGLAVTAALAGIFVVALRGGENSAQAAAKRAAARTLDAGSSRFTISWQAPPPLAERVPPETVEGTVDYVHHRGRLSYPGDNEMLFDRDVTYMRWPMPWRDTPTWVRMPSDSGAPDPLDLQDRAMNNPSSLLAFLTGASDDVHRIGSEEVRGTPTIHYEGTLDLQKVVDRAPPEQRAELQDTLNFIAEDTPTTVPFGLWVDGDGIAHRLRIDQDGGPAMTIEYYDFGIPVEITPPPADETISSEAFFNEMEQHTSDASCGKGDDGGKASVGSDDASDSGTPTSSLLFLGGGSDKDRTGSSNSGAQSHEICIEVDSSVQAPSGEAPKPLRQHPRH